jgi:hypothetical protein
MPPITWQNVAAPNFKGVSDTMDSAVKNIDSAFTGIDNLVGDQVKRVETERVKAIETDSNAFLDAVNSRFQTSAQLEDAERSGVLAKMRGQYGELDRTTTGTEAMFGLANKRETEERADIVYQNRTTDRVTRLEDEKLQRSDEATSRAEGIVDRKDTLKQRELSNNLSKISYDNALAADVVSDAKLAKEKQAGIRIEELDFKTSQVSDDLRVNSETKVAAEAEAVGVLRATGVTELERLNEDSYLAQLSPLQIQAIEDFNTQTESIENELSQTKILDGFYSDLLETNKGREQGNQYSPANILARTQQLDGVVNELSELSPSASAADKRSYEKVNKEYAKSSLVAFDESDVTIADAAAEVEAAHPEVFTSGLINQQGRYNLIQSQISKALNGTLEVNGETVRISPPNLKKVLGRVSTRFFSSNEDLTHVINDIYEEDGEDNFIAADMRNLSEKQGKISAINTRSNILNARPGYTQSLVPDGFSFDAATSLVDAYNADLQIKSEAERVDKKNIKTRNQQLFDAETAKDLTINTKPNGPANGRLSKSWLYN